MRKSALLAVGAIVIGGAITGTGTSFAFDAPPGQVDCQTVTPGQKEANVVCANNTTHPVQAELWINCKPKAPDQHTSSPVEPGTKVTLHLKCSPFWAHVSGGAASVH